MPIIAAKIDTLNNMHASLRVCLLKAGLPEYSHNDQCEGFQVWDGGRNEGEALIHWHTFDGTADQQASQQRFGLEQCAHVLQEHYWIKLGLPGLYTDVRRPTLRVVYRLTWLS